MSRKGTLFKIALFMMLLLALSGVVYANEMDDIIKDLTNLLTFVGRLFTIKLSGGALLGFVLFLVWVIIFSIIYIGASFALKDRAQKNQIVIISLAISLITLIMLYVQKEMLKIFLGQWFYMVGIASVIGALLIAHKLSENSPLLRVLLLIAVYFYATTIRQSMSGLDAKLATLIAGNLTPSILFFLPGLFGHKKKPKGGS